LYIELNCFASSFLPNGITFVSISYYSIGKILFSLTIFCAFSLGVSPLENTIAEAGQRLAQVVAHNPQPIHFVSSIFGCQFMDARSIPCHLSNCGLFVGWLFGWHEQFIILLVNVN